MIRPPQTIERHSKFFRNLPEKGREQQYQALWLILAVALALVIGYLLADRLVVKDVQDALQYRLNLQFGVYRQSNFSLFAFFVSQLDDIVIVDDPFVIIGAFTCASYIYLAFRTKAKWYKIALFAVLLVLPILQFNYTQVIRQGFASAIILHGLLNHRKVPSVALLLAGGLMHFAYLPFSLVVAARIYILRKQQGTSFVKTLGERRFDRTIMILLPVLWALVYAYQEVIIPPERAELYFTAEASLFKRLAVSSALAAVAWLLYPKTPGPLASFMAFATISIAIVLPFTYDFLRMQTYIMPFIVFAALVCKDDKRSLIALGLCLAISLYIRPDF